MTADLILTLLNVVCGLVLTGIGIEMVNNPPGDVRWKKWLYRVLFGLFGCVVVVATGTQSVRNTNEQSRLRQEAQKTEKDLSTQLGSANGKLDAIAKFEGQFLDFLSKQKPVGTSDATANAYTAMAQAIMKMAQGQTNKPPPSVSFTSQTIVRFTHNLNTKVPQITCVDEHGNVIEGNWTATDPNTVVIQWAVPASGTCGAR